MEQWKPIEGFEGLYEISNLGRVKSLPKRSGTCNRKESIRKLSYTKDGYIKIRLCGNGKDITTRVHRLVANAFIPNPENKNTVNHIDGDKTNNKVDNLEWVNRSEQLLHAYSLGLKKPVHTNRKLTISDVEEIRKTFKKNDRYYGASALAKKFGVTHKVILGVVNNETYKEVNFD